MGLSTEKNGRFRLRWSEKSGRLREQRRGRGKPLTIWCPEDCGQSRPGEEKINALQDSWREEGIVTINSEIVTLHRGELWLVLTESKKNSVKLKSICADRRRFPVIIFSIKRVFRSKKLFCEKGAGTSKGKRHSEGS